jgi:hypothetical protein
MNSTSSSGRLIHWAHLFLKARERFLKTHETPRAGPEHAHLMLSSNAAGKGSRLSISSAADLFGVNQDGAVLVRPDGIVAWRARGAEEEPEAVLRDSLQQVGLGMREKGAKS